MNHLNEIKGVPSLSLPPAGCERTDWGCGIRARQLFNDVRVPD